MGPLDWKEILSWGWPLTLLTALAWMFGRFMTKLGGTIVRDGGLVDAVTDAFRAVPEEMRGLKAENEAQTIILTALQAAHEDPEKFFKSLGFGKMFEELNDDHKTLLEVLSIGVSALEKVQEGHSWSIDIKQELERMRLTLLRKKTLR